MVTKRSGNSALKIFFTSTLPLFLWMAFIYSLSARHKVAFTSDYNTSFVIFKSLHLIEYSILYFLSVRFMHFYSPRNGYLKAFLLTFLFALSDEYHQTLVPGRGGKLRDALIDGLGAFICWKLLLKFPRLETVIKKI
jgi:VanZ family protein